MDRRWIVGDRITLQPFINHAGIVAPIDRVNVDTDAIIPKQFLKRIERTGFGQFLFFDWRFLPDGALNPNFVLNAERYRGASILLARANFGCGSSREHAPWALADYGFKAVIAPSFADIFRGNCIKNAILPIVVSEAAVDDLFVRVTSSPGLTLDLDLPKQLITGAAGLHLRFELDPFEKQFLLEGLDDIGLTLKKEAKITAYEQANFRLPS